MAATKFLFLALLPATFAIIIPRQSDDATTYNIPTTPVPSSTSTGCPTVTETATLCSTCAVKECLAISTIANPCSCPASVSTSTTAYPCSETGNCPLGCASTLYFSATGTSECPSSSSTSTSSSSSSSKSSSTTIVTSTTSPPTSCPIPTSTNTVCSTCIQPKCMAIETLTRPCACQSSSLSTYVTNYPCDSTVHSSTSTTVTLTAPSTTSTYTTLSWTSFKVPGTCPTGCAGTSYVYEDEPNCTQSETETVTEGDPLITCTPTVTISKLPEEGCGTMSCATGWNACILDKLVTLPCGCDTAAYVVTSTSTVACPTTEPCYMCNTGFPWTVTASDCSTTSATPVPTQW